MNNEFQFAELTCSFTPAKHLRTYLMYIRQILFSTLGFEITAVYIPICVTASWKTPSPEDGEDFMVLLFPFITFPCYSDAFIF